METIAATGLPWRVMTTGFPRSEERRHAVNEALAWATDRRAFMTIG
jgi:hypothetical protein